MEARDLTLKNGTAQAGSIVDMPVGTVEKKSPSALRRRGPNGHRRVDLLVVRHGAHAGKPDRIRVKYGLVE